MKNNILNIAGYKFVSLTDLIKLQKDMKKIGSNLSLTGTILLSPEGINIMLAGDESQMNTFKKYLLADERFNDMTFRKSFSESQPFKRFKVKIKKEIITMREPLIQPEKGIAPNISPEDFKQWLDEKRDITIVDTRNEYEIEVGAFQNAVNLHLQHFCEFPQASEAIAFNKPIVMYCTGGIRCEKAALYLLQKGYQHVYQLQGGILNYFATVGNKYYDGDCYVFDERTAINAENC